MTFREEAVSFACGGEWLYGVIHKPEKSNRKAVVVVVGGPQYRVGSHRQFVLLARHLARAGVTVLRFDYRGMGDSSGSMRNFEDIGEDIRAAIDCLSGRMPVINEFVLWGLCDAASAILFYAAGDRRVSGIALLNPWVRTEQSVANTYLRHYYVARLRDPALWRQLLQGKFQFARALRSMWRVLRDATGRPRESTPSETSAPRIELLPDRMLEGMQRFRGRVLLVLSGDDITANEFRYVAEHSRDWQRALADARVVRRELAPANHTFSRREWRDRVSRWTEEWICASADRS
jgi:exosortase A-associated hydrolase 1